MSKQTKKTKETQQVERCPDCGTPLVPEGGCLYCPACGWSKCGN